MGVEVHDSARRHGIEDADIVHAVVVFVTDEVQIAIHAMPMRPRFRRLLR